MPSLRVGFAGTPEFAAAHLQALLDQPKVELVAVWTQPDRPSGRGKKTQPSAVKALALERNLPVLQPLKLTVDEQKKMQALQLDLLVVVAYGLILPQHVLDTPRLGCINVHASLLPRWRGAAPIHRAVQAGDKQSGICIMQMDAGLDTGAVISRAALSLALDETTASLHERLITLGKPLLCKAVDQLANGTARPVAQSEEGLTYASKISKSEAQINWARSSLEIERDVRAFNPFPIAYTLCQAERLRIGHAVSLHESSPRQPPGIIVAATDEGLDIACGCGVLRVLQAQLPGRKMLGVADLLRGSSQSLIAGQQLGE